MDCVALGFELHTRATWSNPGTDGNGIDMDLRLANGWPQETTSVKLRLPMGMPLKIPITHTIYMDDGADSMPPHNMIAQRDDSHRGVEKLGIAHCNEEWCDAPAPDGSRACQKRCTGNEEDDVGHLNVAANFGSSASDDAAARQYTAGDLIQFTFVRRPSTLPTVTHMSRPFLLSHGRVHTCLHLSGAEWHW